MKIGDRCFVHGYVDEIRKDTVIIKNKGGYFGTDPGEVITVYDTTHPNWIPCSERLPEGSDGTVLVCFPDEFPYSNKEPYINAKHNQRVKTASYSQFNKTWYIGDFGAIGEVRPIAWMPLPEPYKEEQDGH